MSVKSAQPVWVRGKVVARTRRAVSFAAVDRSDRERVHHVPRSLIAGERESGAETELLVPTWWAYRAKLPTNPTVETQYREALGYGAEARHRSIVTLVLEMDLGKVEERVFAAMESKGAMLIDPYNPYGAPTVMADGTEFISILRQKFSK